MIENSENGCFYEQKSVKLSHQGHSPKVILLPSRPRCGQEF